MFKSKNVYYYVEKKNTTTRWKDRPMDREKHHLMGNVWQRFYWKVEKKLRKKE